MKVNVRDFVDRNFKSTKPLFHAKASRIKVRIAGNGGVLKGKTHAQILRLRRLSSTGFLSPGLKKLTKDQANRLCNRANHARLFAERET